MVSAPAVGDRLNKILGRRDHQVGFQGQAGQRPQAAEGDRPKGDVGHIAAVHHVQLNAVHAGRFHNLHLFAEPRKIRRKNRRSNFDLQDPPPRSVKSGQWREE